ncbi:Glycosyltransferase involved in cell wall bisynthesis [Eubacterium ruminantium]|nr:Glycosyltransferase involved in cell wall bisynthesis [Eubacterium ruminantium]
MKKISVMIPCYNEKENVVPMSEAIDKLFKNELKRYDYELLFIDNCSTDGTKDLLRQICKKNKKVRVIFNARNFGQFNSPYHGLLQTTGECTVGLCCDFQDPVELIPKFVEEWENGAKLVCAIKEESKENKLMRFFRNCYYKVIKKLSNVEQIANFTGFGLYSKEFLEVLRQLDDPIPFLRGVVAELGYKRVDVPYVQNKRRAGKTHNNFFSLYDGAMLSFTSYTKAGLRIATFLGFILSALSLVAALVYLVLKLIYWDQFPAGMIPVLLVVSVLGSVQLFFIGLLGEYIMSINQRVMKRPLVVEEERINFDTEETGNND